jgi:hypothetical protein
LNSYTMSRMQSLPQAMFPLFLLIHPLLSNYSSTYTLPKYSTLHYLAFSLLIHSIFLFLIYVSLFLLTSFCKAGWPTSKQFPHSTIDLSDDIGCFWCFWQTFSCVRLLSMPTLPIRFCACYHFQTTDLWDFWAEMTKPHWRTGVILQSIMYITGLRL